LSFQSHCPLRYLHSFPTRRSSDLLDPYGVPTILVSAEPTKNKFKNVVEQLRPHGLMGAIRGIGDTLTIKVFQKPQIRPSRRKINLWMFLITIVTLVYAGYFVWSAALF